MLQGLTFAHNFVAIAYHCPVSAYYWTPLVDGHADSNIMVIMAIPNMQNVRVLRQKHIRNPFRIQICFLKSALVKISNSNLFPYTGEVLLMFVTLRSVAPFFVVA